MKILIGRKREQDLLARVLASDEAELVALYGRRRVGKTFLIREYYKRWLAFEFSGKLDANLKEQLANFSAKLDKSTGSTFATNPPKTWFEAFERLKIYLNPLISKKKVVVFFDEFPWIDTPKSNFLSAFDYFWNDWASKKGNLKIVICGSTASWMIKKIIQNKGGLHNRVTQKICLMPFSLGETDRFLKNRNIRLDPYQIVQLYMAFGGIPHYLKEIQRGQSTAQIINELCFNKTGFLANEFDNLYRSLFGQHLVHVAIVRQLAQKTRGLSRTEIIEQIDLSSGGTISQILDELQHSGFISTYLPFGKNHKDMIYKLSDEYSLFYLRFIEKGKFKGQDVWNQLAALPSYKIWCGFAFESLCLKHISAIKKALGIAGIYTETSIWRQKGDANQQGTQIDLLIDRKDNCINICEMKFTEAGFVIDKKYAQDLQNKVAVFKQITNTKKTIFVTGISTYLFKENEYKNRWIDQELTITDLFE